MQLKVAQWLVEATNLFQYNTIVNFKTGRQKYESFRIDSHNYSRLSPMGRNDLSIHSLSKSVKEVFEFQRNNEGKIRP